MTTRKRGVRLVALAAVVVAFVAASGAHAADEWRFGIGTGFFGLNVDGDVGFDTALGTVVLDASVDNGQIRDLTESAFGVAGFAATGKWQILYSVGHLGLEDSSSGQTGIGAIPTSAEIKFDVLFAEVAGVYGFAKTDRNAWGFLFGGRHISHDYDFELAIGAQALDRSLDQSWTDAIVGVTHAFQFTPKVAWATRLDVGAGGSDGTVNLQTGINWQVAKALALSFYGKGTANDFENEDPGDPDYYLYDVDEFGLGIGFLVTF